MSKLGTVVRLDPLRRPTLQRATWFDRLPHFRTLDVEPLHPRDVKGDLIDTLGLAGDRDLDNA